MGGDYWYILISSLRYFVNDISDSSVHSTTLPFWSEQRSNVDWLVSHQKPYSTMHKYVQFWTLFGIFIVVAHIIIFTQVSSDDYEIKFQMLKGNLSQVVLKYWLLSWYICETNLRVPWTQVALWHSSWLSSSEIWHKNSSTKGVKCDVWPSNCAKIKNHLWLRCTIPVIQHHQMLKVHVQQDLFAPKSTFESKHVLIIQKLYY